MNEDELKIRQCFSYNKVKVHDKALFPFILKLRGDNERNSICLFTIWEIYNLKFLQKGNGRYGDFQLKGKNG